MVTYEIDRWIGGRSWSVNQGEYEGTVTLSADSLKGSILWRFDFIDVPGVDFEHIEYPTREDASEWLRKEWQQPTIDYWTIEDFRDCNGKIGGHCDD